MESAFGPYERGGLWVAPEPMCKADRIVVAACAAALIALVAIVYFWG
jgi:hypothetical protein